MSLLLPVGRLTARVRRCLARRPLLRWAPIVVASVGLVAAVADQQRGVSEARAAWGDTRAVWVASADVHAGEQIRADDIELPVIAVPAAAVPIEVRVDDTLARQRITAGEIITHADVAGSNAMSLLPDGWRAVAITESPSTGAQVGDVVDLASDGIVIADGALVIDHVDHALLIGVPAEVAPLVALAAESRVTVLRTGHTNPG